MEKLKTATGKEFDCDYVNPGQPTGECTLRIGDVQISTVATVFSNQSETVQLWCGEQYAANYTRLVAIVPESGAIRVVLGKE